MCLLHISYSVGVFWLESRVEIRGGSRRSKRHASKQMAKPLSKPLPTTTLMAAATLMTSLTNPDLACHAEQEKRAEHEKWRGLGAACRKFDRMLQQASTNQAEWAKNKLIVKRQQKRVASLRKHVKKKIIIDMSQHKQQFEKSTQNLHQINKNSCTINPWAYIPIADDVCNKEMTRKQHSLRWINDSGASESVRQQHLCTWFSCS